MQDHQINETLKDRQTQEVLDILQEEAAEVIQAVSKIRRFGWDNNHPSSTQSNLEHLEEELGDIQAMVELLMEMGIVSWGNVTVAKRAKIEKLKKWSNIFNKETV
jgi:NTP pyrophosphatase (non-canonical NTP hydrolase)